MMQPAQDWHRADVANRLGTSEVRGVFVQVGPDLVVVGGVGFEKRQQSERVYHLQTEDNAY